MIIYDANNCRKFIERIKKINHRMHYKHTKTYESPPSGQNSARLAHFARDRHRSLPKNLGISHDYLNRSAESMIDLRHRRHDSIINTHHDSLHKRRGPHSNRGEDENEITSLTMGGGRGDRSGSIKAGNYTIDVIKKLSPQPSVVESAKFISEKMNLAKNSTPLMLPTT
jgi:hypothetical protein